MSDFLSIHWAGGQGICPFERLLPYMTEDAVAKALCLCPDAASVCFVLFPYLPEGEREGNLSKYARGLDYHAVLKRALEGALVKRRAEYPENRFVALADDSPLPETVGAYLCGAGALGQNGLIFDGTYGSFVFIGAVLTDLPLAGTEGGKTCLRCGACQRACPGGALKKDGFDKTRCLSHLTQKNGALTGEEMALLRRAPFIWGCDICQDVCPLNHRARRTTFQAFAEGLIFSLSIQELAGLTRRQFLEKYPERAFTWRGPAPLRRNLDLKK